MIAPALLGALASVALATLIAGRALRSHRLPPRRLVLMALAWFAIIAALAMTLPHTGLRSRTGGTQADAMMKKFT